MSNMIFSLDALAELKKQEEDAKKILPFGSYIKILKDLVKQHRPNLTDAIESPKPDDNGNYVCIREPLEFIELFNSCSGQDECDELFRKLLASKDKRVVEQIIPAGNEPDGLWFNTTKNGINLRPGFENEESASPTCITLGDDSVHSLAAGRTGSGKSVFLNSVILSMMAEYPPWELDLYLADFKKVEFSRYMSKYETPHIKAVAATSEIRYVVSLLSYLATCMNARQDFFALIGIQKLSEIRDKYQIVIPRVLLVVDEFTQMFLDATPKEAAIIEGILTSVTKLGRATGYHLMFASQDMSGTLSQSVFSNFKARFALPCDADVSSRIIGNTEASKLDEKGFVIANIGAGKEDTNRKFKVPYVSEAEFYSFLEKMTGYAENTKFNSIHKFYQEDNLKDFEDFYKILDGIFPTRKDLIKQSSSIFDIFTLGESVIYNRKKYDYETFFLERGVRKNIGIFTPVLDDAAYVCKLLSANFCTSPNANRYRHFVLARNDLFMKRLNIAKELNVPNSQVYYSLDFFDVVLSLFDRRKKEAALVNSYRNYKSLESFAKDVLIARAEMMVGEQLAEKDKFVLEQFSHYFADKSIDDIPATEKKLLEDYEFDTRFFRILDILYEKEHNGKTLTDCFEPFIFWMIGMEMVGKLPSGIESMLTDALNYNMLFIMVASDCEFNDFSICNKACDNVFVSGNNEKFYTKTNITYTKKNDGSPAIDFGITSCATQRAFKKFRYELNEIVVPYIDFDSIMCGDTYS